MSINYINTGSSPNKGDGDTLRTAFSKINGNFEYVSQLSGINANADLAAAVFTDNRFHTGISVSYNSSTQHASLTLLPATPSTVGGVIVDGTTISIIDGVITANASLLAGPTGPKGDTGDVGPKGDTGDVGPKGDTGDVGPKGDTGDVGPKGDTGGQGDIGPRGPKGDTGLQGDIGPKGDTGGQGDIGPRGPKGDTGDVGPVGPDTYTPANTLDWTGSPTVATMTAGLDELANRVHTVETTGVSSPTWELTSSTAVVSLSADGKLTLPNGGVLGPAGMGWQGFSSAPAYPISVQAMDIDNNSSVALTLDASNGATISISSGLGWAFGQNGTLSLPASTNILYTTTNALIKSISDIQISAGDDVGSNWIFGGNGKLTFPDSTIQSGAAISIADLKTLVAASTDFADFQSRIAGL